MFWVHGSPSCRLEARCARLLGLHGPAACLQIGNVVYVSISLLVFWLFPPLR